MDRGFFCWLYVGDVMLIIYLLLLQEATQAVQSKYGDNQLDDLEDSLDPPLLASKLTPLTDDL